MMREEMDELIMEIQRTDEEIFSGDELIKISNEILNDIKKPVPNFEILMKMRREEIGVMAAKIRTRLEERLGVEVQCSWNDKEITILAFVNSSDYKEFVINAENVTDINVVVNLLEIKYKDKKWEIHEADGSFRDFKTFAEKCGCENIVTWGHEAAWEGVELHRLDYYDSYSVYRANDCYSMTLYDDLDDVKIVVNFSDDEVRVYDLKSKLEIEDYYEIA